MQIRVNSALLTACLSLCGTSAMSLPIGERVTIDKYNGPASGTVVDFHPTTGESKVHVDGEQEYLDVWLYDKDIHLGAAAAPETSSKPSLRLQTQVHSGRTNGTRKYKIGQRVEYIEYGKWFKAIITGLRDDGYAPYHVHALGYIEQEHWAPESFIRNAGSGPTEPVPGGEANDDVLKASRTKTGAQSASSSGYGVIPSKKYHCVYFVVDHLTDAAPFTITGKSTYTDSEGKTGTYSFNPATSNLTFHGGNYDGQSAIYETSGGLARLHILGPSGRAVIDCD